MASDNEPATEIVLFRNYALSSRGVGQRDPIVTVRKGDFICADIVPQTS